jgi:hypothetical protein
MVKALPFRRFYVGSIRGILIEGEVHSDPVPFEALGPCIVEKPIYST